MCNQLKITIAQINPILGNLDYNCSQMLNAFRHAKINKSDLVVFPELSVTGYPVQDLVLKPIFQQAVMEIVEELATFTLDAPAMLIGFPYKKEGVLYNAMGLLQDGKLTEIRLKHALPNCGVSGEKRHFNAAPLQDVITFKGVKIGVPICEDIWFEPVCEHFKKQGADIIISTNCSPFSEDKLEQRYDIIQKRALELNLPVVYINQVGGQDELVFDGASFVISGEGQLINQLPAFIEATNTLVFDKNDDGLWQVQHSDIADIEDGLKAIYHACVLGLRDYVIKNRFPSVVIGLSGGVDSALCAAIAVDALGEEKVNTVMMPYDYTAQTSIDDAKQCADILGIKHNVLPIGEPVNGFNNLLSDMFKNTQSDKTEENLQSRTRGVILMAISDKFNSMVITTGNKSEVSVGYSTLYGDMCGGFNPIKDIYKTDVFALCKMRNNYRPFDCWGKMGEVIPQNIIDKPPTAELRENPLDQDSLPAYNVLDDILNSLIELNLSHAETIKKGKENGFEHSPKLVKEITNMVYGAEYKRRQAAPGVRVSPMGFGSDRRYPITNGFREDYTP